MSPTAALVVEASHPGRRDLAEPPFYAKHRVGEALVVDPEKLSVDGLALSGQGYELVQRISLTDLEPSELGERIGWLLAFCRTSS